MSGWSYDYRGNRVGPIHTDDIRSHIASGHVSRETVLYHAVHAPKGALAESFPSLFANAAQETNSAIIVQAPRNTIATRGHTTARKQFNSLVAIVTLLSVTLLFLATVVAILVLRSQPVTVPPTEKHETAPHVVAKSTPSRPEPNTPTEPQLEPFEASDENGHLVSRGFRVLRPDGNYARTGKWTIYFPNGLTREEGEFKHDRKTGRWTFYVIHRDAHVIDYKADFRAGEKVYGIMYLPLANRNIPQAEGAYVSGRANGEWTLYFETGEKKAAQFWESTRVVNWSMFRKSGKHFASFAAGVYILDGARQIESEVPKVGVLGKRLDYCSAAWEHAIKHLWEAEGR